MVYTGYIPGHVRDLSVVMVGGLSVLTVGDLSVVMVGGLSVLMVPVTICVLLMFAQVIRSK